MFRRLRRRFTYANVMVTFALVFAMSGGAYAAKHYLVTSTKQISPKVLRQLQGKAGPAGPEGKAGGAGAAGKEGVPGKEGAPGKDGTNGKDGVSVTGSMEPKGANCKEGGSKFLAASGTTYACNGEKGKEGTFGGQTLPPGKTLRGAWALSGYGEAAFPSPGFGLAKTAVSFALPIAPAPIITYIGPGEGENEEESKWAPAIKKGECHGYSLKPGAAEGQLCIFAASESNLLERPSPSVGGNGETAIGFLLTAGNKEKGAFFAEGSWAATAQ